MVRSRLREVKGVMARANLKGSYRGDGECQIEGRDGTDSEGEYPMK